MGQLTYNIKGGQHGQMLSKSGEVYFEDLLKPKAMAALVRLLEGEQITKVKRQNLIRQGKPTGHQKITTTQTQCLPDFRAVIFVLERLYPERFGNRAFQHHKMQSGIQIIPEQQTAVSFSAHTRQAKKEPSQWKVFVSSHIKTMRSLKRNSCTPILKAL